MKSKIIISFIMVAVFLFTAFFGVKQVVTESGESLPFTFKGIITVWHVETFEGGSGSRRKFLLDCAKDFEKKEKGVLVSIINHTPYSIKKAMEEGERPDLISYGIGLTPENLKEIHTDIKFTYGTENKKIYALPWCVCKYCLISKTNNLDEKKIEKLIVSSNGNNLSLISLILEDYKATSVEFFQPVTAYRNFVNSKDKLLLGTQRDVIRLKNTGEDFYYLPLNKYVDNFQYISLMSADSVKTFYIEEYLNLLLSEKWQKSLSKINMFSAFYDIEYPDEYVKFNGRDFLSVIYSIPEDRIRELSELSVKGIYGDSDANLKIKNNYIF